MYKKVTSLCVFLLISFSIYSQEREVILQSWDFKTLEKYINSDSLSDIEVIPYAKAYLEKAKYQKDHYKISDGYFYNALLSTPEERSIYGDSILELSNKTSEYRREDALIFKGGFFYKKTDYKQALDYYLKALEFAKNKGNKRKLFSLEYNIGTLQSITGDYRKSLDKFLNSFQYISTQKEQEDGSYLNVISALATSYQKLGILDSATYYTRLGVKRSKNKPTLSNHYYALVLKEGVTQFYKKNYGNSQDSIQKTIPFLKEVNDTGNLAYAYFYAGKIYYSEKQIEKAILNFKKLDTIFLKDKVFFPESRESYEILIKHYKKKNDLKNQLVYTERLLTMDSTMYHKNIYVSKKIIESYDTPKLLANKEELISLLKKKGSIYQYVLIFSIVIICIISILLLYYYKRQKLYKKNFDALIKKNDVSVPKVNVEETPTHKSVEINVPKEIIERVLKSLELFKETKGFLSANLTLHQLAKNLQTNHTYLSKIINVYENKSFSSFLNELRIDYTIDRLQVDDVFIKYTIDAIAEESGFSNTRSFTRAFQRKTNINPSYFIKSLKKQ